MAERALVGGRAEADQLFRAEVFHRRRRPVVGVSVVVYADSDLPVRCLWNHMST